MGTRPRSAHAYHTLERESSNQLQPTRIAHGACCPKRTRAWNAGCRAIYKQAKGKENRQAVDAADLRVIEDIERINAHSQRVTLLHDEALLQ